MHLCASSWDNGSASFFESEVTRASAVVGSRQAKGATPTATMAQCRANKVYAISLAASPVSGACSSDLTLLPGWLPCWCHSDEFCENQPRAAS